MKRDGDILRLSPSDLSTFLACAHATALHRAVELGERAREFDPEHPYEALVRRKGDEHEAAYLQRLRDDGRHVVEIDLEAAGGFVGAARQTAAAMRDGAEVVYQGTFVRGRWRGRADFLERVAAETDLGAWGYEAVDTKLARTELKPNHVLQLAFYSAGIQDVQRRPPERMHLVLGSGARESLRVHEFAAYHRHAAARLEQATDAGEPTEAYPNQACPYCDFKSACTAEWRRIDHLRYVANIRRDQVERLRAGHVDTLTALAGLPPDADIANLAAESLATLRAQARLQRMTIDAGGAIAWELQPVQAERGFSRLPRPSPGDVVLDVEGDPFWTAACGLTFLFGLLLREAGGWRYEPVWAHSAADEKAAFQRVIDLLHARLEADPAMHLYHYSPAEPGDLKRLMGAYATREDEVDELLRRGVFVDLLTVIRQGVVVGLEGYGLKGVERLAGFQRTEDDVGSGADAVLAYEQWLDDRDDTHLTSIARYNEDDCRATVGVLDWLHRVRPAGSTWLEPVDRRALQPEAAAAVDAREALRARLAAGEVQGSARWLAGELLYYHRREAKPAWWRYFALLGMSDDDLVNDGEAVGGLGLAGPPEPIERSLVYPLRYPPQEHKVDPGDQVVDPRTEKRVTVERVDLDACVVYVRRGQRRDGEQLPTALVPGEPIRTRHQQAALERLARSIDDGSGVYRALTDLLGRAAPRFAGRPRGARLQTTELHRLRELASTLDDSTLVIQGPPGTGKTWTGARLITELLREGRRVGVTAFSHKAIDNLLWEIERAAATEGLVFSGARKTGPPGSGLPGAACIEHVDDHGALSSGGHQLVAGTTWLFARPEWDRTLDVLVIDEAGQLSLADALAAGTSARNLILLGDPLQLSHVSQGTHPGGTGASVLEHALGEHPTVPPQLGILLDETWRMHPDICGFISREIYESRLRSRPECARQGTAAGTGLRYVPIAHQGNSSSSPEEAAAIATEIESLLGRTWTDVHGTTRAVAPSDIMVVAPYNAQVRLLRRAVAEGVPVGTVDRFQGQEAPIVFFSMATSSGDDLPRDVAFLFSRNRLNVALSRARCVAYVVCSPALLTARARTVDGLRLISTLCAAVEAAGRREAPPVAPLTPTG